MFTELHALIQKTPLLITVSSEGDAIRLSVSPTPTDSKTKPVLMAVSLVGTPAELDEGLAEALLAWQSPRKSLLAQVSAAAGDDEAPPAKLKPPATVAPKSKPGPKTKASAPPPPADLTPVPDAANLQTPHGDDAENLPGTPPLDAGTPDNDAAPDAAPNAPATEDDAAPAAVVDEFTLDLF